jgi:2OG-Fe(II) oxygenase superfamily
MLDTREGSNIINLSLGDAREFVLTSVDGNEKTRVVLEDGDLFVLGPRTNASLKHAVLPVKDEQIIERHGAAVQPRISIVLRDIGTQLSRAQVMAKIAQSERSKQRARQAKTYPLVTLYDELSLKCSTSLFSRSDTSNTLWLQLTCHYQDIIDHDAQRRIRNT